MSFGWSAGDIATAVTVVYNLIQALDSCDGAAGDYRETVSFLQDLKRTLEPLQTFTAWNAYPTYGRDIGEHVGHIKGPVEQFLSATRRYEPGLGARAQDGHHRHVVRKLQWHIFMSKKVLGLKKKIESHMRIIDTLMQRLTLDMVWTTQQKLPDTLRATFQETLRPELITVLQECLPPLNLMLLENYQEAQSISRGAQDSRFPELYEGLSSDVEEIKRRIGNPKITKQRIESCLQGDATKTRQKVLSGAEDPKLDLNGDFGRIDQSSNRTRRTSATISQESLQEVYYLVFLYLGHFLQNLFHVLSRLVQPSRALMPTLLAKYNISFLDAIGRPPRILPYEHFRYFEVLQAFIRNEFKDLPGSAWVDRGRYLILSLANDRVLNEHNWGSTVVPGTTVAMSMLVQKRYEPSLNLNEGCCPESSCSGTWTRSKTQPRATCPVCQKEVFYSAFSDLEGPQRSADINSQERTIEKKARFDDNIAIFKRVVEQGEDPFAVAVAERASLDPYFRALINRVATGMAASREVAHFRKIIYQIIWDLG
ncbi:hypothetical protein F5B21DRAFT_485364 [Xylaria acuta]|nr:hypothetical protein F5B21DRAFT_485364 [Xylaria acuta]